MFQYSFDLFDLASREEEEGQGSQHAPTPKNVRLDPIPSAAERGGGTQTDLSQADQCLSRQKRP